MARTDWTMEDFVKAPDLNEIGAEINTMKDEFIKKSIAIPAGADLNTYMTEGSYYCPANAIVDTLLNVPTAEAFHLTVEPHAGVSQTLTTFQPGDLEVYQRNYYFGWGPWKKVPTSAEVSQAETNAKNASLPRTGGALSGRVDFQTWGSFSADAGGGVLYGSNCYLDPSGSPRTFRYTNTHINFGARGIFLLYTNGSSSMEIYEFDTGTVASTAGAAFTPSLKRILNADDVVFPNDNPTTNLLINSTGLFGLDGWTNIGGVPIYSTNSPDVSGLFYTNEAVPSGQYAILKSNVISVSPGAQYDIQSLFFSSGSPVGTAIQIELKNAANDATFYTLVADPQKWWHRKKGTVTIPAGITQVSLWLVVSNAPAGQTKAFARIRFNLRNTSKDVPYDLTGDMAYVASQLQAVKTSGVDAKNGVVGAINAKGGSASINDTWAQLAGKINAIQQGRYQTIKPTVGGNFPLPPNTPSGTLIATLASFPAGTKLISGALLGNRVAAYCRTSYTEIGFQIYFALVDDGNRIWQLTNSVYGHGTGLYIMNLFAFSIDLSAREALADTMMSNDYRYPSEAFGHTMTGYPPPSGFNTSGVLRLCVVNFGSSPGTTISPFVSMADMRIVSV